jgi:hypothetical protein
VDVTLEDIRIGDELTVLPHETRLHRARTLLRAQLKGVDSSSIHSGTLGPSMRQRAAARGNGSLLHCRHCGASIRHIPSLRSPQDRVWSYGPIGLSHINSYERKPLAAHQSC